MERFVTHLQQECAIAYQNENSDENPLRLNSAPDFQKLSASHSLESTYRKKQSVSSTPFLKWFGCGSRRFERNELKRSPIGNHYGYV